MQVPAGIFRQYDIRGLVDAELTPAVAHGVGGALTTFTRRRLGVTPRIAVGRDNRPSGERLARAARDGTALAGGTAVDVGLLPTPALYLAVHQLGVQGGVQVTGSHNPPEFNGFKRLSGQDTLHGDEIQEVRHLIETDALDRGDGRLEVDATVLDRYAEAIVSRNGPLPRRVKVVVDCGNGVASVCAVRILTARVTETTRGARRSPRVQPQRDVQQRASLDLLPRPWLRHLGEECLPRERRASRLKELARHSRARVAPTPGEVIKHPLKLRASPCAVDLDACQDQGEQESGNGGTFIHQTGISDLWAQRLRNAKLR